MCTFSGFPTTIQDVRIFSDHTWSQHSFVSYALRNGALRRERLLAGTVPHQLRPLRYLVVLRPEVFDWTPSLSGGNGHQHLLRQSSPKSQESRGDWVQDPLWCVSTHQPRHTLLNRFFFFVSCLQVVCLIMYLVLTTSERLLSGLGMPLPAGQ